MKVLFLDFDGVLNSEQFFKALYRKIGKNHKVGLNDSEFCPIATSNLLEILTEVPDCNIVVSSSWRIGRSLEDLREILHTYAGIPKERVIGKTPSFRDADVTGDTRGRQIEAWLKEETNPHPEKFAIVDDDSDMAPLEEAFVKTSWQHGLQLADAQQIIRLLGGPRGDPKAVKSFSRAFV